MTTKHWQFWIDRGGTFTDVVALSPRRDLITNKLLSENPEHYHDAAIEGIRRILASAQSNKTASNNDRHRQSLSYTLKMGTTVATNALLERTGAPTLLLITKGFGDALRIGYQHRPDLFALQITLPDMLYSQVIEADERISAQGEVLQALDEKHLEAQLQAAYDNGLKSIAIVLMHAYKYPQHEQRAAAIASRIGFTQVSVSSATSPLAKIVSRGDTTVVDAYLSPILRRYVKQVATELDRMNPGNNRLQFMQSNGGLTEAHQFAGKDAILSGPAGGVVGMVQTATTAGYQQLIGFDMGGTSTDVCHYAGAYERTLATEIAGVRVRAPMMRIHTVAAGGGSIVHFDGARFRVGPDSAGANPGPASYNRGGPLCVTDCNIMLGRIQPDYFPKVFGSDANQALDTDVVRTQFSALAAEISGSTGETVDEYQVAAGFLTIAIENMANAIKKISVQRGYDVASYTLCCFGGAGGQHACRVADALGIERIFSHPLAGVLSAYGMGLADLIQIQEQSIEAPLNTGTIEQLITVSQSLFKQGKQQLLAQGAEPEQIKGITRLYCSYPGSDTTIPVILSNYPETMSAFESQHRQLFGFTPDTNKVLVQSIEVEVVAKNPAPVVEAIQHASQALTPAAIHPVYCAGQAMPTPFYQRSQLPTEQWIEGPAVIIEDTGTLVIESGWRGQLTEQNNLILERYQAMPLQAAIGTQVNPVMLEIFNNLFMSIAEQMGFVLERTAVSVNIKERLDFSCAIFDATGDLVANAPHMPVHLGSMSESIKTVIQQWQGKMQRGDAFVLNAPYNGGTHLPDVTVIKPVFEGADVSTDDRSGDSTGNSNRSGQKIIFYVACRGHHADIGGISPGSMPADSTHVDQEGVLLDNLKFVHQGEFGEADLRARLNSKPWPARRVDSNIADLKAQLAACEKGMQELIKMVRHFGLATVQAYMHHVQDNAEESVRRVIDVLSDGDFCYPMDNGLQIKVSIRLDKIRRQATIDFTGTSPQHRGNFNAPSAIARAAVLYVFRSLVNDQIPLNEGCLKPLTIILPEASIICPQYPAAVVAGNVETSQAIVDTLLGALGMVAASQGTMNNISWGNAEYQYYETLCGGEGASEGHHGCHAVHTHMTNSRLTDPEVLEARFPVMLESFAIHNGSGGKGIYSGGDGVVRKIRFKQDMWVSLLTGHRRIAPYGLNGGKPARPGKNTHESRDGNLKQVASTASFEVAAGDAIIIETPGGGGFGQPS